MKSCKLYSESTHESFTVMRNCVTELYALDPVSAYQHAFVYIRQLAIHVRNATTSMTEQEYLLSTLLLTPSIHLVYNWQFVNCLRLWTYMVCQPSLKEAFQPLVYPLVQVIDSTLTLIPTARYYPLRLHCVELYLQLIAATGVFIPVAPLLLDLIENDKFLAKFTTTAKPPDVRFLTRIPKTYLASRPVQDAVISKAIALLADYFKLYERHVALPELAYPVARSLKAYAKKCRVSQWSAATKALATKLEKQIEAVIREREGISGSPMELKNVQVEK